MAWNSKRALVKKAAEIANKKYPKGYGKQQLIECSKEVYGGFSTNPFKKIKTKEDVGNMANHMSEIDGGYPRGMSTCFVVGINGGCGVTCPAFIDGECDNAMDFCRDDVIREHGVESGSGICEYYPELANREE